ncbi:MAG TPA: TonB-dependent receptor plug domain-containing protein [Saprospiraceae bacterium]|nr:TonB-dependent receptor plug domain-containing protein [Saprospiraceae bacterium]HMP26123.1 TonB-dependent receptor plug domain-containing protein [Saprospiraceae bacterium]
MKTILLSTLTALLVLITSAGLPALPTQMLPEEVQPIPTLPIRPVQYEGRFSLVDAVIPGTFINAGRLHVLEMLIGQVPGVWITGTPFYYRVRVRGALQPPIVVIDNFPFYNLDDDRFNDLLLTILPQDVQRIEVIKNIAGASLYGPGAGNGVIRIFTKRGGDDEDMR